MVSGIHLSPFAILSIIAGVILLGIAWRGWPFQRYPGAKSWTMILIVVAIWDISYGVALTVFVSDIRWVFDIPLFFARAVSVPLILVFALEYTGRESLIRSKWMYGVFGFYFLAFVLAATNPIHHLMFENYRISPVFGAAAVNFTPKLYYILAGISYITILLVVVIFADLLARYRSVFGRQVITLIVALLGPSAANVAWILRIGPSGHLDLTPLGHILAAIIVTYALFRQEMFQILPATRFKAEQAALDDLGSAVFSITNDGLIVNLNTRAVALLDEDKDEVLLEEITDYIQLDIPEAESRFTLSNPFGRQNDYAVAVSEIMSDMGEVIGFTIALQDITTEQIHRERLAVLNRVFRHNLRNTLNVIDGYAQSLEQETTNPNDFATRIREKTAELLRIGEKARTIENIVSNEGQFETSELSSVIDEVKSDIATSCENCTIKVAALPEDISVNSSILLPVLREVIENGCKHNDSDDKVVSIGVSVDRSEENPVTIVVRDNGPGIPSYELAPLQERTETDLEHGSGIGLWLTNWGVSVLNGNMDISVNDPSGTVVTLQIPIAE